MKPEQANVIVAIPTNGNDGREEMSGVFDYVNRHPHWSLQIVNTRTDIAHGVLYNALKNADGLILAIAYDTDRLADRLINENPRLKMVIANDHLVPLFDKNPRCRTLLIDSVSVGKDAARYFNSLGRFASYGFVHGAIRYPWSVEREEGFRASLPRNMPFFVFPNRKIPDAKCEASTPVISHDELAEWLGDLPKPSAVFGANDLFAREVLTVCRQMGLNVPKQVTVIGCDNDPLIWSSASPHLSSLQLPFRELGFKAAEMLDKMLRGRKPPMRTIRVGGTHLFERESSAHIPPATILVENAREYISEHACEGIGAIDVIRHVRTSRSLLELRFRQVCGKSILEDILDVRLAEVQRQLEKTNRSILQIGRDCGFNAPNYLKRLFRKRFGASMREYRAAKGPFSAASAS